MSYIPAVADPCVPQTSDENGKITWRHRVSIIPRNEYERGYGNFAGMGSKAPSAIRERNLRPNFISASHSVRTDDLCSFEATKDRIHTPLSVPFEKMLMGDRIFQQQVGLEISRIHAIEPQSRQQLNQAEEAEENLCDRAERFFMSRYPLLGAHGDCDAMEFPTPPCGSLSGLLYYWNHYQEACAMYNQVHKEKLVTSYTYKRRGRDVSVGTGGLHIHTAFPDPYVLNEKELELFKHNITMDAVNNPHIPWLFQEWYKNGTNPYLDFAQCRKAKNKTWTDEDMVEWITNSRRTPFAVRDERMSFRNTTNTTEYRCFETPDDFSTVWDLIRFVYHHQAKILRYTLHGIKLTSNFSRARYLSNLSIVGMQRQYIYDFEMLGLKADKYLDLYFDKHYVKRKENGSLTKLVPSLSD